MADESPTIRYITGEVARVGDHVKDHEQAGVVEDIIATPEEMARWGSRSPGSCSTWRRTA